MLLGIAIIAIFLIGFGSGWMAMFLVRDEVEDVKDEIKNRDKE
jgi:hypothetical protein